MFGDELRRLAGKPPGYAAEYFSHRSAAFETRQRRLAAQEVEDTGGIGGGEPQEDAAAEAVAGSVPGGIEVHTAPGFPSIVDQKFPADVSAARLRIGPREHAVRVHFGPTSHQQSD